LSKLKMHRIQRAYHHRSAQSAAISKHTTTHPIRALRLGLQPHQLNHRHLHQLVHPLERIQHADQVPDGDGLRDPTQGDERVALARRVGFGREEGFQ
jgi:hypothetical protein